MIKDILPELILLKGKIDSTFFNKKNKIFPLKILKDKYIEMVKYDFGDQINYMFIDKEGEFIPYYVFVDFRDKTENEKGLCEYYFKDYFYSKEELRKERIKKLLK